MQEPTDTIPNEISLPTGTYSATWSSYKLELFLDSGRVELSTNIGLRGIARVTLRVSPEKIEIIER